MSKPLLTRAGFASASSFGATHSRLVVALLSAVRVYQWPKNVLVFVPLLVGHEFELAAIRDAVFAFLAFSLAASATYVFNDLRDAADDAGHAYKHARPFASGVLSQGAGIALIAVCLLGSAIVSSQLPSGFALILLAYLVGATGYTLLFKRMLGLDIVVIASLYVLRVVAGDEAIGSDLAGLDSSDWILGFSCLIFLSLALIKRCSELSVMGQGDGGRMPGRAYRSDDFIVLISLAGAAALAAIAVFVRYIGSSNVGANFTEPRLLWLVVPLLAYWLIRLILLANRRKICEDPMLFTFKDRNSQVCGLSIVLVTVLAW